MSVSIPQKIEEIIAHLIMTEQNIDIWEEYESWKKESFTNTNTLFLAIENIGKITFLYHLFPMEQLNLYTFSIIFLQIRTILLLIMFICIAVSNRFSFNKSKRTIQPILEKQAIWAQDTKIEFTSLNECSICMEINYNN